MGKIVLEQNRLIFQRRDELVVIEAYGRNCLRTRATRNACISDENWTLLPPATEDNCIIEGNEDFATITNGDVKATIEAGFPWYGGIICRQEDSTKQNISVSVFSPHASECGS